MSEQRPFIQLEAVNLYNCSQTIPDLSQTHSLTLSLSLSIKARQGLPCLFYSPTVHLALPLIHRLCLSAVKHPVEQCCTSSAKLQSRSQWFGNTITIRERNSGHVSTPSDLPHSGEVCTYTHTHIPTARVGCVEAA